jgi:hypothetical protein
VIVGAVLVGGVVADFGAGGVVVGRFVTATVVLGGRGAAVVLGTVVAVVAVVVVVEVPVVVEVFPGSELALRPVPPGPVVVVPFEPETTVVVADGSFPRLGVVGVAGVVVVEVGVAEVGVGVALVVVGVVGTAPGRSGITVLVVAVDVVVVGNGRGKSGKSITTVVVVVDGWVARGTVGSVRRVVGGALLVDGSVSVGSSGSVVGVTRGASVGGEMGARVEGILGGTAVVASLVVVVGDVYVVVEAVVVVVLSAADPRTGAVELGDALELGVEVLGGGIEVLAGGIVELERPEVVTRSVVLVDVVVVGGGFVVGTVRGLRPIHRQCHALC